MKKILTIMHIAWVRALTYRGANFIYLLLGFINILVSVVIWSVAYQNPLFKSSVIFSNFISYYFVLILFNQLVNSFTSAVIAEEHIKHGLLSIYLLKPFPYLLYMALLEIPWRFLAFIFSVPVILFVYFLTRSYLQINFIPVLGVLSVFGFFYLLSFLIQVFFALLTFWFEETRGTSSVLEILILLFSGFGIPIFFFPAILQTIGNILPFQYVLYFPVMLSLGKLQLNQVIMYFSAMFAWILILAVTNNILWKRGLKHFTGEGI